MTAPTNTRPNPYVGPRPFRPGERIYGRDREIDSLINVLIAERVVLLYSPSGAGKSSLVQAGLLPYLESDGGFGLLPIARVNLEPDPTLNLIPGFNRYTYSVLCSWEEAKPELERLPPPVLAALTISDYLNDHVRFEKPAIVMLLDQFEEVLTIDPMNTEAKHAFFEQVGRALRDKSRWALFSMREDFIAGLDPYLRPIPTRLANRFRLDLLALEAALQAVQLPAASVGVTFEEATAKRLVDDLRRIRVQKSTGETEEQLGPYVEPVQLQVVCRRLWETLQPEDVLIDHADVEAAGDADQALSEYYAACVRTVAETTGVSERTIRTWCDQQLITETGIRGQVLLGPQKSQGLDNSAVRALEKMHLVRSEKRGGTIWFELAHDRLIQPVRQNNQAWFEAHLSDFQRRAEVWNRANRPDYLLLSGRALFAGMKWAASHMHELNDVEKDFWAACAKAEARAKRDQVVRYALIGLGVFVAVLGVLVALLYVQAENQRRVAEARALAAAAVNNLETDPELSVLLSLQAAQLAPDTVEVQEALHRAIDAQRIVIRLEHPDAMYIAKFTADDLGILTAGADGVVRHWALDGSLVWQTSPEDSHTATIYTLVLYPGGEYFATGSKDGTVKLWLTATGQLVRTLLALPDTTVWWLALDPATNHLGVAASDGNAYVIDRDTGARALTLTGHIGDVYAIAFNGDNIIATGGADNSIRLWSYTGVPYTLVSVVDQYDNTGTDASEIANDPVSLKESNGITYRIRTTVSQAEDVQGLNFDPQFGSLLYSTSADRTFRVWSVFPSFGFVGALEVQLLESNSAHTDWVYGTATLNSESTHQVATFSEDRTVRVWDMSSFSPREIMVLRGHKGGVFAGDFSSDGVSMVTASRDGYVLVWHLGPSQELFTQVLGERVYAVDISPDSQTIVSGQRAEKWEQAAVWSMETGTVLFELEPHNNAVEAVEYSPDGQFILTGSRDGYARVFAARDGALLLEVFHPAFVCLPETAQQCYIYGIAWSPDGTRFATGGRDGRLVVWHAITGAPLLTLDPGLGSVADVDFSHDGQWLASGHARGFVALWDAQAGQRLITVERFSLRDLSQQAMTDRARLTTLEAQRDVVEAVDFSPDDKRLITASADGSVYIWDITDPVNPVSLGELFGHLGGIYTAQYDPSGRYIVTGSTDKRIKVWDAQTFEALLTLPGHLDRVYAAVISADGQRLVSGGADGLLRAYTLTIDELVNLARQRVTRTFTIEECRKYLHTPVCPAP